MTHSLTDPANHRPTSTRIDADKPPSGSENSRSTAIESLTNDHLSVGLVPALGGSLAWFRAGGKDLTRPLSERGLASAHPERFSSGFPLVPYSNRIAMGTFVWLGETVKICRNFGEHPHSLHGFGWQRAWKIQRHSAESAILVLDHLPDKDWPWACQAQQEIRLSGQQLELKLSLTNTSDTAMPAGLGWHPYFVRTPKMSLQFQAERVWTLDHEHLPERPIRVPKRWDYSQRQPVDWPGLDHCFAGWQDRATLSWPEHGLQLQLACPEPMGHLVVYTPENTDFIALEPVTHVNNAHNLFNPTAQGLAILSPGETLSRQLIMTVESIDHDCND